MNILNLFISIFAIVAVVNATPIKKHIRWNWPRPVTANRQYFNTTGGEVAKVIEGNIVFHAFKQFGETYTTNIVEFPTQLIVVDFGIDPEFGKNASEYARTLNKNTITCFLTHEHPDHFMGYEAWKDLCTRTFALNETLERLTNYANTTNDYTSQAQTFLNQSQVISAPSYLLFDNVKTFFEKLVNIETAYFLYIQMPQQQAMFTGDIVTKNSHNYMANNQDLRNWFGILSKFRQYGYRNVFIGHGFPVDYSNNNDYYREVYYLDFLRNVANTYKSQEEYTSTLVNKFPTYVGTGVIPCPFFDCTPYSSP